MSEKVLSKFRLKKVSKSRVLNIANPILAVLIALIVSGLFVLISGGNPINAFAAIFKGAFGSPSAIRSTFRYALPLLLLAICFTMSNRCGYFNVGQEGQIYASALAITTIEVLFGGKIPNALLFIIMLVVGMIVGGFVSFIPAYLKAELNANECVTGIILNYIFLKLSDYMLQNTALHKPNANTSMSVNYSVKLPGMALAIGGIALVILYAFFMKKTVAGYRLRVTGSNPLFARFAGIDSVKMMFLAGILSGMLASVVSTGELTGIYRCFYYNYEDGMGFTAMTVALIGKQNVGGMIFGALLLGALQSGSIGLSISKGASPEIVIIVRGFIMLFGTISVLQYIIRERKGKGGEK